MLATLPKFEKFPKIPRLNREVVITEKIDGTNAGIWVDPETKAVTAAKRGSWLLRGMSDNFGFGNWVYENEQELQQLGPGMHWGEWWGDGIQRRYGLNHKRFSLFNVGHWTDGSPHSIGHDAPPDCCYVVPILDVGVFDQTHLKIILDELERNGSWAKPGFMKPEGIIMFHCASRGYFKVTIEGDEKPKKSNEGRVGAVMNDVHMPKWTMEGINGG